MIVRIYRLKWSIVRENSQGLAIPLHTLFFSFLFNLDFRFGLGLGQRILPPEKFCLQLRRLDPAPKTLLIDLLPDVLHFT